MKFTLLELADYLLKRKESKLIDLTLPEPLKGIWDEEKYTDELYCTLSDFLPNTFIYQIDNGVVHFKSYYGHEDEKGYEEIEDDIALKIDLGLVFKAAAGLDKEFYLLHVENACFEVNRRTPRYEYIESNLEDALTYLEFGWWIPGKPFHYTQGVWNGYVGTWEKRCIKRELVPGVLAVPFFNLEGRRQVVVSQDNLEKWGITEDYFFETVLLKVTKRHFDSIPSTNGILGTIPPIKYHKFYDPKVHYGLSTIFAPMVAPELEGAYGNLFCFVDPWNGVFMMIDHKGSYMTSLASLYLYLKEHVKFVNNDEVFAFKICWIYQGVVREVKLRTSEEESNGFTIKCSELEQELFGTSFNITPDFSGN